MPKILGRIESKRKLKKVSKDIYKKEYNRAKADVLKKSRQRSRKQIQEAARKAVEKKYGLTAREKATKRKEKMGQIGKQLKTISENIEKGLDESDNKKKSNKSIWDLELNDFY